MSKKPPIKSVRTLFEIVEKIVELHEAGVSTLATELDRPKSTIHDHLRSLEQLGYVVQIDNTYRLTTKFLTIGGRNRQRREIYRRAEPEVNDLAEETGEHASLVVEDGGRGVVLHTARGDDAIQVDIHDGMRFRLHTSAPGKAILAYLPEERVHEILDDQGMPRMTKGTITDRETLFEQLEQIREDKYAQDDEERIEGMRNVSAPILSRKDEVLGSVSVYGPTNRISDESFNEELPKRLLRTANVVEINLNYR